MKPRIIRYVLFLRIVKRRVRATLMQEHHRIWLEAHPHRTEAWLRERLGDRFDIHHIDGNHDNNEPRNLVLIESADHMGLHGMRKCLRAASIGGHRPETLETGEIFYRRRVKGMLWNIAAEGYDLNGLAASSRAHTWAKHTGAPWPIKLPSTV